MDTAETVCTSLRFRGRAFMSKLQDKHSHNSGCFEVYLDFKLSLIARNRERERESEFLVNSILLDAIRNFYILLRT